MKMALSGATRRLRFSTSASSSTSISSSTVSTIRQLARNREFTKITSILSPYLIPTAPSPDPLFSSAVSLLSSSGMVEEAVAAINAHPSPSTASLNALLSPLNYISLSQRIPDLLNSLTTSRSIVPDQTTYGILIKSLCRSPSGAESTISILNEMKEKNIQPNVIIYTTIMDSFYKEKNPEKAEEIWKEMRKKGIKPDLPAYNAKIMYKSSQGEMEDMNKLIDEMKSIGLKPDIITYSCLIKLHCKNGEFDEAMKVFKGLEEKGIVPNYTILRHFVTDLCRKEKFLNALEVFDDGIKIGNIPDLGTVRVLVQGLVKENMIKEAKRVVVGLRRKYPKEFNGSWKKLEKLVGFGQNTEQKEKI